MKAPDLSKACKDIGRALSKHSPAIFTGVGIAAMASAIIFAVKATPEATKLIEDEQDRKVDDFLDKQEKVPDPEVMQEETKLTPVEVVKVAWKPYIPAAVAAVSGAACIINGNRIHAKRNAALIAAYQISEEALKEYKEYRDKVVEEIGEKKEQVVHDEVVKDEVKRKPVQEQKVICTGKGETLCYDITSGRYFKSDIDSIRKSENILNRRLIDEMYISLNDYYYEMGLRETSVGNDIGWNIDSGMLEFEFTSMLTENEIPCLVINFSTEPRYDYSKLL